MATKVLGPIKSDGKIIQYNFPLSYDYKYARALNNDMVIYIRTALARGRLDLAQGFSYCHCSMLNSIAMEHLVNSVK